MKIYDDILKNELNLPNSTEYDYNSMMHKKTYYQQWCNRNVSKIQAPKNDLTFQQIT